MANVLLVAYLLIVLALIVVILLQRSEGGALGIGGGGSGAGFMTARGSANLLTRTTGILAVLFFATAIGLTILTELDRTTSSIVDRAAEGASESGSVLDALDALGGGSSTGAGSASGDLPVPTTEGNTGAAPAEDMDSPDLAIPEAPDAVEGDETARDGAGAAGESASDDAANNETQIPSAPTGN